MRKIALGHFRVNEQGRRYVDQVLSSGRLSYGPFTREFERKFAKMHGCDYGIFCNSGTSALHISLLALKEFYEWPDNAEVIVPATTFIATSNAVLHAGLTPVFVDVDPRTYNIDVTKIFEKFTSRTRAIIPVHLFGLPANMSEILRLASTYNVRVVEDSCEAVLAGIQGQSIGSFGDLACFSTYVSHFVVGGVGGVVTTNNPKLADLCRSFMAHGRDSIYTNIDQDDSQDLTLLKQMVERRFSFDRIGYSFRATEFEAAIALSELERVLGNVARRRMNAVYLTKLLSDLRGTLQLPTQPRGYGHAFMMYPMVLGNTIDRDEFLLHLEQNGIETRLLFPLLSQPVYKTLFPRKAKDYPVSEWLAKRGFFIGMHQGLTYEDMDYISDVIHPYLRSRNVS